MWTGANWPSAGGSQTTLNIVTGNSRRVEAISGPGRTVFTPRLSACIDSRSVPTLPTAWFIAVNICTRSGAQCCQPPELCKRAPFVFARSSHDLTWRSNEMRNFLIDILKVVRLDFTILSHLEIHQPIRSFRNSIQDVHFDIFEKAILWRNNPKTIKF